MEDGEDDPRWTLTTKGWCESMDLPLEPLNPKTIAVTELYLQLVG